MDVPVTIKNLTQQGIPIMVSGQTVMLSPNQTYGPVEFRDVSEPTRRMHARHMVRVESVIVTPTPMITSPSSANAVWGVPFNYQATADVPATFSATGLPDGLTLNQTTGLISGTPTGAGAVNVIFTLSATGAGGTGSVAITLSVTDPVPQACVNGDVAYAGMALTYHRRSLCTASLGSSVDGVLSHVSGSTFAGTVTGRDLQPNGETWGDPYPVDLTVIILCTMENGVPCYDIVEAGNNWTETIRHGIANPTGFWANTSEVCTAEWVGMDEHHSGTYTGGSHAITATLNVHSWTCSNWVATPYIDWTNEYSATIA